MGIGDEILCAGEARRRVLRAPGTRYLMLDRKGRPKWHFIWEGNTDVARPGDSYAGTIGYVNGFRAYCAGRTDVQWRWRAYAPHAAFIALPDRVRAHAARAHGAVVFNPTIKVGASPNKDWGISRWQALIAANPGVRWLQVGDAGETVSGAERVRTEDFFEALGLLSGALAVVCHEGALHHAAAALGTPAVVIRGGFIGPRVTGYAGQTDLFMTDERYPLGCGMRSRCTHCEAAMRSIRPDDVAAALQALLSERIAA